MMPVLEITKPKFAFYVSDFQLGLFGNAQEYFELSSKLPFTGQI